MWNNHTSYALPCLKTKHTAANSTIKVQHALSFHTQWKANNREFYQSRAINSSGITNSEYLTAQQNEALFSLLADNKLIKRVKQAISEPLFLNTQLFLIPLKLHKKIIGIAICNTI